MAVDLRRRYGLGDRCISACVFRLSRVALPVALTVLALNAGKADGPPTNLFHSELGTISPGNLRSRNPE
jgi:hypothetical protein